MEVNDAEELYDKLFDFVGGIGRKLTYTAENWLEEFLKPLGYERKDQSRVSCAIKNLVEMGLVTRESVKHVGGYHAKRRADYPRPRKVTITVTR